MLWFPTTCNQVPSNWKTILRHRNHLGNMCHAKLRNRWVGGVVRKKSVVIQEADNKL